MLLILYIVWGSASSEVIWGVGIISSQGLGNLRSSVLFIQVFKKEQMKLE